MELKCGYRVEWELNGMKLKLRGMELKYCGMGCDLFGMGLESGTEWNGSTIE